MFKNVGKKIMALAKVLVVLDIIGSIILSVLLMDYFYNEIFAFIVGISCGIISVLMCWPVYGFGQIVDDVHIIKNNISTGMAEHLANEYEVPEL